MKTTILNREFQHPTDGWYQIETPGEHLNEKSGVLQVIDSIAVNSIVNRFNQEADDYQRKNGEPFPGMLIDHEHFKHQADKETRAYGWLMRLKNRNGIPFGQITWTNTGKPAIDGGDYRFFSSEYDPRDLVILENRQKPARVRPMRLDGLTLTNDPNNKGGAPITNRGGMANQKTDPSHPEFLPTPALDKWLQAVQHIQHKANLHGNIAIDFNTAWGWAKTQFPDLYDAAFGTIEQSAASDAINTETAAAQVASLANRISNAAGRRDLRFGWNFVRENLPAVYNRALPPAEVILNRDDEKTGPATIQKKAADLFSQFAFAAQTTSGLSSSQAWHHVTNRRPALVGLAAGSLTLEEACAREPELRELLA